MAWKNFTENEIVNPLFNGCPAKTWQELPKGIQENLKHTMTLVQALRDYLGIPLKITSTWRPTDKGSPHSNGHAIDIVSYPLVKDWPRKTINWLQEQTEYKGFRVFWEYSGINEGWIHIDRGFKDNGKNMFYIGFKRNGKMVYEKYKNISPIEKK